MNCLRRTRNREELDWQEDEEGGTPDEVKAGAVNRWLFNEDTVDKVLQFVMENGVKTDMGDRVGKTIVFARNHNHAIFIEERFNANYPHYRGHFARVIDNYAKYPGSLIEEFSDKESELRMAISVDMLDTGIGVPEVVNLVFFKPIHSKIKFLRMMGRGTRLSPTCSVRVWTGILRDGFLREPGVLCPKSGRRGRKRGGAFAQASLQGTIGITAGSEQAGER